jgi:hypothetical protein
VSRALRALLEGAIDYAGMFPPTALALDAALANYRRYRAGEHAWMLGRFVIAAAQLPGDVELPFAVLTDGDRPGAVSIESKRILSTNKPTYCEVSLEQLDRVKQAGSFVKLRTGGVTPDAIPSIDAVAEFIHACAQRRLPFKATAGLHHAIRSPHPLTYEPGAPVATMHGFINVFLAAAFAWHGTPDIRPILAETDASAFRFDNGAHWRDRSLSAEEIQDARTSFAHSFGSCSFEEPIADLEQLGWL